MISHAHRKPQKNKLKIQLVAFAIALVIAIAIFIITKDSIKSLSAFAIVVIAIPLFIFVNDRIKKSADIRKMEEVFPDFIELMASNLRAGTTIEKALLMSSRKEFAPLDVEISLLGKDIVAGKEVTLALSQMAERIKSGKITKTIDLIISGIKSGGNISVLLEETAVNMRERSFIEKRASSNVLMYEIFIFFAVAIGAPLLFGLSAALVQIMTNILSSIPITEAPVNAPFVMTKVTVSVEFVSYLSIIFLAITSLLASMIIGLVSNGDEKTGLKYSIPLAVVSIIVFFVIKIFMTTYFAGFFT